MTGADPNPTLHRMMVTYVRYFASLASPRCPYSPRSHEIHNFYVDLHPSARQYKKKKRAMLMQRVEKAAKAARKAAQKASRQVAHKGALSLQSSGASLANIRKPPAPAKSLSLELVNFQDPEVRHTRSLPRAVDIKHCILFTAFESFSHQA